MLTQDQIDFYHRTGYLAIQTVLWRREIEELRRVTDEFVEKSRALTQSDDVFDFEPDHTRERPLLRRLKNPADQHPVYDRTLRHEKILNIVSQLIGPGIRYNGQKLNMKIAEVGSPVEWHQDWAFYPHTNDDLLAVGVAIDDMTLENGCLLVIPGSHKGRIYDHHQDGRFAGAITESDFSADEAVPIELEAGGISIHHARLLHGSMPNISTRPRRILFFQYCAVDAWPLKGVESWEKFNSYILRGKPTYEPRLTCVPVRVPVPPAEHQGSIYEVQSVLKRPLYGKRGA